MMTSPLMQKNNWFDDDDVTDAKKMNQLLIMTSLMQKIIGLTMMTSSIIKNDLINDDDVRHL